MTNLGFSSSLLQSPLFQSWHRLHVNCARAWRIIYWVMSWRVFLWYCSLTRILDKKRFHPNSTPGPGLYFAIFVIYLKCASERSGTPVILFYALCLLYVLCTASAIGDSVNLIFQVRNNSIFKYIIFFISCYSFVSVNYLLNFKPTQNQCYFALGLSKSQQAVVPTSSRNLSWYA